MSDQEKEPNNKNNRRPNKVSLPEFNTKRVDETLETLDKGSPKLNWIYVLLTMIIIFLAAWVAMLLNPESETETQPNDPVSTEITELQADVESLEERMRSLEE